MPLASHPLLDAFFIFYTNSLVLIGLFVVFPSLVLLVRGQKRNAAIVALTALAAFIISSGLKLVFERSRPETVLLDLASASGSSLPSTHAMIAFSVVPALILFFPSLAMLVIAGAALMGFSRLYVGVHYLSDVVVGAVLGLGLGSYVIATRLKQATHKVRFELKRKVFHILFGSMLILGIYFGILTPLIIGGLIVLGLVLSLLEKKRRIPLISELLDHFEREKVRTKFPGEGMLLYLGGAFIAVLFFPKDVALASITVLAIGDSVSHIAGISIGKIPHPLNNQKFIEGWVLGLLAAYFAAVLFVPARDAFIAALAGMLIEAFDVVIIKRRINDNLLIPPIAGIAILIFRIVRVV